MQEFCFETVLSTERNLMLLNYILTVDSMINVWRVKAGVESGEHDVPEEKIVARYDKALALVKELIKVCDICHIYDNSASRPFRIFKKRKERIYFDECDDWHYEDVCALTDISTMERKNLN